ncbi:hypothetical protein MMC27_000319 [Xylographa pallens]|nr:hypothetical protein [Xylographa pallens]
MSLNSTTPGSDMAFQTLQGFEDIEKELLEQKLIDLPPTRSGDGGGSHFTEIEITPQMGIRDLFKTTQSAASFSSNAHPAICMIVEWMKSNFDVQTWEDKRARDQIFGSIDLDGIPEKFFVNGVDNEQVASGGIGLLIKAFYNSCREYDDHINMDKCNQTVADVNTHIWEQKIPFLIEYYRQTFGVGPFPGYMDAYRAVLLSKPFKTLKQHQAISGSWLDANLEMFHHFVKLAACGASDDEITKIYHEMITVEPKLDGSAFGEIHGGHWRTYEGWLSKGYLDWGDLGAQNLRAWYVEPTQVYGAVPQTKTLVDICVRHYGYWKEAPSSSCFSRSSRVRMASGETKAICDIKPGDRVLSNPLSSDESRKYRTVAFLSTPWQGKRCLYELQRFPGIHFTSTHPILMAPSRDDDVNDRPILQFVDRISAMSLNPLWQSFQTTDIDQRDLIVHKFGIDQDSELVYDLILKPLESTSDLMSTGPLPTFVMVSTNGQQLTVISEAPPIEWFPLERLFISNVIRAISSSSQDISQVLKIVNADSGSLQSTLRGLSGTFRSRSEADGMTQVSLESLLRTNGRDDAQIVADLIEKLITRLGRTISKVINSGWLNISPVSSPDDANSVDLIFIHILRRLDDAHLCMRPPISSSWTLRVQRDNDLKRQYQLAGRVQGQDTLILHQDILLQHNLKKKNTNTASADSPQAPQWMAFELVDEANGIVWQGRGPLEYGVQSMISVGDLGAGEAGSHAVVEVELCSVSSASLEHRPTWGMPERKTYAASLGYTFGLKLIEDLTTARKD